MIHIKKNFIFLPIALLAHTTLSAGAARESIKILTKDIITASRAFLAEQKPHLKDLQHQLKEALQAQRGKIIGQLTALSQEPAMSRLQLIGSDGSIMYRQIPRFDLPFKHFITDKVLARITNFLRPDNAALTKRLIYALVFFTGRLKYELISALQKSSALGAFQQQATDIVHHQPQAQAVAHLKQSVTLPGDMTVEDVTHTATIDTIFVLTDDIALKEKPYTTESMQEEKMSFVPLIIGFLGGYLAYVVDSWHKKLQHYDWRTIESLTSTAMVDNPILVGSRDT